MAAKIDENCLTRSEPALITRGWDGDEETSGGDDDDGDEVGECFC